MGINFNLHETPSSENIIANGEYLGSFIKKKTDNTMLVRRGSRMVKEDKTYKPQTVRKRESLFVNSLKDYDDDYYELTEDVAFNSPALAAGVLLGKEISTNNVWIDERGNTFNDIKAFHTAGSDDEAFPDKEENRQKVISNILSKRHYDIYKHPLNTLEYTPIPEADELVKDIDDNPEALFIATLMDRRIKAERAWTIPYLILQDFGSLDFESLGKVPLKDWVDYFVDKKLHIDNKGMAKVLYRGIKEVNDKYRGDPANIWKNEANALKVINRFKEFHGVGPKISTMIVNILYRDFHVPFQDLSGLDISPDIQVVKVFYRTGLINSESINEAINKAREMNPNFPGIVDFGTWEIGREYCKPQNPNCSGCPLRKICEYNLKNSGYKTMPI